MLHTLKRYWRLYRVLIVQFFKVVLQSKVDFLMGLLGFFLTQATGIIFLYLIFQQIPTLQGWTLDQLIFIYGFAQIPRGIDHLLTDNIWLVAYRTVINGEFDRYMLRPMNVFFQVIAEKLQPDALGELLIGTILVVISATKGVAIFTPVNMLLFLVSILAGALIYTSIKLFFASLAFWLKQSCPFLQVAYEMAEFAKYPTEI
ncbi:MAG: ABC transporter permease, partial [Agathobacter sp.]